jgi:hypothetical protein
MTLSASRCSAVSGTANSAVYSVSRRVRICVRLGSRFVIDPPRGTLGGLRQRLADRSQLEAAEVVRLVEELLLEDPAPATNDNWTRPSSPAPATTCPRSSPSVTPWPGASRDPRPPRHRCQQRSHRGAQPVREEGEALRAWLPELQALPAPRTPPCRRCQLAEPSSTAAHPDPCYPLKREGPPLSGSNTPTTGVAGNALSDDSPPSIELAFTAPPSLDDEQPA